MCRGPYFRKKKTDRKAKAHSFGFLNRLKAPDTERINEHALAICSEDKAAEIGTPPRSRHPPRCPANQDAIQTKKARLESRAFHH
jgi:hypothetical protein